MHPRRHMPVPGLALVLAMLVSACQPGEPKPPSSQDEAPVVQEEAPPPPQVRGADPSAAPVERAAPPMLQPVTLGEFIAIDDQAKSGTGALHVEDTLIRGANGAIFVTERIAVVRGDDEYRKGARYSDVLMVGAEQPVELRRVVQETSPETGVGTGFCGARPTGYLALARIVDAEGRESLRMIALQGEGVPAASSSDTRLCQSAQYIAKL